MKIFIIKFQTKIFSSPYDTLWRTYFILLQQKFKE